MEIEAVVDVLSFCSFLFWKYPVFAVLFECQIFSGWKYFERSEKIWIFKILTKIQNYSLKIILFENLF